jgi:hypothetical protein
MIDGPAIGAASIAGIGVSRETSSQRRAPAIYRSTTLSPYSRATRSSISASHCFTCGPWPFASRHCCANAAIAARSSASALPCYNDAYIVRFNLRAPYFVSEDL